MSDATPAGSGLGMGLRIRLSIMMFLQYAIWGAWWVVLVKYLGAIDFSGTQIGAVYGTTAIASIISPLIFGQIADRWVPTQYLLAVLHLAGAATLYFITQFVDFTPFYLLVLVWAILYIPTISLTNALSFHQISDAAKYFPGIRVFGTIGWIVVGLMVGIMSLNEASVQPILFAATISALMGVFCLALPHTPPKGETGEAFPALRALGMFKDSDFAVFLVVSFVISTVLAAYFAFTAQFLSTVGVENAAATMTIGQFSEMILLPFLPFFLKRLGMKWTLALGMAAWGVRYAIFSIGGPPWLVIASLALHGVCYDFFFVAAYIHTDNKANAQIRASAQALFNIVTMGAGMLIGNLAFGALVDHYTREVTLERIVEGVTAQTTESIIDWSTVWAIPAAGVIVALVIFAIGFRPAKTEEAAD